SPNARELNLVMTIVGHSFSDKVRYQFHVDSGPSFGHTTATTVIECRFPGHAVTECRLRDADAASLKGRFRVFARLRDDPFFKTLKGPSAAYQKAAEAHKSGAPQDAAGCPSFGPPVVQAILEEWRHTDGGPATNLLAGWTPSAIVISVDVGAVNKGGKM